MNNIFLPLLSKFPKVYIFIAVAAVGCFIAALISECFLSYNINSIEDEVKTDQQSSVISFALRSGKVRDKFAGNKETELAIRSALMYLQRTQNNDGSWLLEGLNNKTVGTAMAILALQGYGVSTVTEDPLFVEFVPTLRKAWDYLLAQQDTKTGAFQPQQSYFYSHAICTIAICEHLAMSKVKKKKQSKWQFWNNKKNKTQTAENNLLKDAAQKAVNYMIEFQGKQGGWRYSPNINDASDLSVTGWVLLALMTAKAAELEVSPIVLENVSNFIDTVQGEGGSQYGYMSGRYPTLALTAEGLLCRILLGWEQTNEKLKRGIEYLLKAENLPNYQNRNLYYWYYAAQTLHHYGTDQWIKWNDDICKLLIKHQEKDNEFAGSWNPQGSVWGGQMRLYATFLSTLILETNYRHESIFDRNKKTATKPILSPLVQVILWSSLLCFGMAILIVGVQNLFMRKPFIKEEQIMNLVIASAIAGCVSGYVGQTLFLYLEHIEFIGRIIAWAVLGGILALGMSLYIANLDQKKALGGGALGGMLGAIGFLVFSFIGDTSGRLIGAAILGACIGAMIGLVETMYRNVWLTVIYDPRNVTQVNLGSQPVSVGSGKNDTIFVQGVSASAGIFSVDGNNIRYKNSNGNLQLLEPGAKVNIGTVELIVCSKDTKFAASKFYPMKMSRVHEIRSQQ